MTFCLCEPRTAVEVGTFISAQSFWGFAPAVPLDVESFFASVLHPDVTETPGGGGGAARNRSLRQGPAGPADSGAERRRLRVFPEPFGRVRSPSAGRGGADLLTSPCGAGRGGAGGSAQQVGEGGPGGGAEVSWAGGRDLCFPRRPLPGTIRG